MNILVIGNGFDLAHGLPTTYKDFLRFTAEFDKYRQTKKEGSELAWGDNSGSGYYRYFWKLYNKRNSDVNVNKLLSEMESLINNNIWLKYFQEVYEGRKEPGKDGWIDFESEISRVVQTLDDARHTIAEQINRGEKKGKMTQQQFDILRPLFREDWPKNFEGTLFETKAINYRKELLLKDLKRLVRCLEIYLSDYIFNLEVSRLLPEIESLPIINKVLSFNYTGTYENNYNKNPYLEVDYIHGRADLGNTIDTNNMVLGIDEYLKGEARNEEIEFIEFKKFFQRIHKETGCLYKSWLAKMKEQKEIKEITSIHKNEDGTIIHMEEHVGYHRLFFFGHSLDITDKDIIRDLILADRVHTTIFYMDKIDFGRKIANLVRVIGQDEVIKRTGGKTKTIVFKQIAK